MKLIIAIAVVASIAVSDMEATNARSTAATCATAYDRNSDGYIYKGTITLTRVVSGIKERFYLFNKGGVKYVSKSKSGPFYRLSRRMTIDNVVYTY